MATSIFLSPPHDISIGFFIYMYIIWAVIGVVMFMGVVLLEAFVFQLMKWGSFQQSKHGSFVANLATTVLGFIMAALSIELTFLIMWVMSVVIEGVILLRFRRLSARKTWVASLIANTLSYAALFFIYSLIGMDDYLNP